MARVDEVIEAKARKAHQVVNRNVTVVAAYLFGSQVTGNADRWSDIDLAVFAEGVEAWDIRDRAKAAVRVQKEAGDELEVHFFPASALEERDRDSAGFTAWILTHGVEIQP
jgi:predicted nucleotidyltransferase